MMQEVEGLLLRTVKYAETALIFDVYSRDHGLRSYIMHGLRSSRSKVAPALLRPMAWLRFFADHGQGRDLCKARDISAAYIYQRLPYEILRAAIGSSMLELAIQGLKQAESQPPLYDFLLNAYQFLDQREQGYKNIHLWFYSHFASYLGFGIELPEGEGGYLFDYKEGCFVEEGQAGSTCFSSEESFVLQSLLYFPMDALGEFRPGKELGKLWRREFIEAINKFYLYHLQGFQALKSHKLWLDVL